MPKKTLRDTAGRVVDTSRDFSAMYTNLGYPDSGGILNQMRVWVRINDIEVVTTVKGRFTTVIDQARTFGAEGEFDVSDTLDIFNVKARPTDFFQPHAGVTANRDLHDYLAPQARQLVAATASQLTQDSRFLGWADRHASLFYTTRDLTDANTFRFRHLLPTMRKQGLLRPAA